MGTMSYCFICSRSPLVVAACENASEHLRVQSLDSSAKDGRIGGHVLHLLTLVAQRLNELLGTASAKEFHTIFVQFLQEILKAIFVEDRDQRSLDLLLCLPFVLLFIIMSVQIYKIFGNYRDGES